MNVLVKYNPFPNGTITPVASKSISNRVLIVNALTNNAFAIENLSESEDTNLMHTLLEQLQENKEEIVLNAGAAGTVMRFLTTYCCLIQRKIILTGSERMKQRPIGELVNALRTLGAKITYIDKEGYPPICIAPSTLAGGEISLSASVSSQFVSSLMLCAPYFKDGLTINLTGTVMSLSYIELTVEVMREFGVNVKREGSKIIIPATRYVPKKYFVETDWSSASYFYSLSALSEKAEIELKYLRVDSLQGDKAIAAIAEKFGVQTIQTSNGIIVSKKETIKQNYVEYDFTRCPDIVQTVAPMLAGLGVPQVCLTGVHTLQFKETDRVQAVKQELSKFGVLFQEASNHKIAFSGDTARPFSGLVSTYHDHRMAMGFAPLAQKFQQIRIENEETVKKSYVRFWEHLISLGSVVENSDI